MKNYVIVGGGSTGYLLLLGLADAFPDKNITMIDSSKLPSMGVGESVTGTVLEYINRVDGFGKPEFNIDRKRFWKDCKVTFKLGIIYKDWYEKGHTYANPIEDPLFYLPNKHENALQDFYLERLKKKIPIGTSMIFSHLMKSNRVDILRDDQNQLDTTFHMSAIHLDAIALRDYLHEQIKLNYNNVSFVDSTIKDFTQGEDGMVENIHLSSGKKLDCDLVFDCTGFKRLIISKLDGYKFNNTSKELLVNSSIVMPLPYADTKVPCNYTLAQAMSNGWLFKVPGQQRWGTGYNYCSDLISDDEALREYEEVMGLENTSPKKIAYETGYNNESWLENVISVGPSSSFLEPLEATSLHTVICQTLMLTKEILPYMETKEDIIGLREIYNLDCKVMIQDFLNFICAHYKTNRQDSEFWRYYQRPEVYTERTQHLFKLWKHRLPIPADFEFSTSTYYLNRTSLMLWMPVLDGLNLFNKDKYRIVSHYAKKIRDHNSRDYKAMCSDIVEFSLTHNEAIEAMNRGDMIIW